MDDAQKAGTQAPDAGIKLGITCGHLAFARYPVLVGHYNGDTFAGTELRLDQALDSRLSERRKMGLYPGPIGSSTIVLNSNAKPSGAVIVGLGEPATLSIGSLRRALRHGILAFASAQADQYRSSTHDASKPTSLQLSPLLVGAGEGGLDQMSCVQALLQALKQAQDTIAKYQLPLRISDVEIVELYADRACAAWRAARRILDSDPTLEATFKLATDVNEANYGRTSAPVEADPSWWQPIQITMSDEGRHDRALSFTVGGGFARAEARTIAANLDLVAPLVRRVSRARANDASAASPGRALFELLWPASLKDQSVDERNRRLILDERSASFPWEMLDDRRPWLRDDENADPSSADAESLAGSTGAGPPAVRAGMIRQLLQTRFREDIVAPRRESRALVIGNPGAGTTNLPDLPGAEREAGIVANLLQQRSFNVSSFSGKDRPEEICRNLFTDAWQIVHIAAHGVVKQTMADANGIKRTMTGIVLGGGVVLGPSALAKLPVSPEIVFVNCCHLGAIPLGPDDEMESTDGQLSKRPELAANIAIELIRLGGRCVIVAGWGVDDKAAAAFAETFYSEMLKRETFGTAALLARKRIFKEFPASNTWGAYQCYGDPDYRLQVAAEELSKQASPSAFVSVSEAIDAVHRVRDDLNIGLERDVNTLGERLEKIEEVTRTRSNDAGGKEWFTSADLRVALAEAWGELGKLAAAIDHYKAAVGGSDSTFKVRAIEQLANLSVRHAVEVYRVLPPGMKKPAEVDRVITDCLRKIEMLIQLLGETSERVSLQGSCWKRRAQVMPENTDRDTALANMAERFDRAATINQTVKPNDKYPMIMACSARICAAIRTGQACDAAVAAKLQQVIATAPAADADFWLRVNWADARMNDVILRSLDPLAEKDGLLAAYKNAWRHVGSPLKLRSVVEHLEFYQDIFASGAPGTEARRESVLELVEAMHPCLDALASAK